MLGRGSKYIVMMTKEVYTRIINFMTHGAGVFELGCGHISHIVKMHSSTLTIYSTLIAMVLI